MPEGLNIESDINVRAATPKADRPVREKKPAVPASLIAQVHNRMLREIVRVGFAPGERLKIDRLAQRYGVALSAVREALSLLSATGLVIREDRRGFRVAPVSLENYRDVRRILGRLWRMGLNMALENGDPAWEKRLVLALYDTLKFDWNAAKDNPQLYEIWDTLFRAFHREMIAGSNSPALVRVYDGLLDQVERYRWLVSDVQADTDFDNTNHKALVEALLAHDAQRLQQAMENYGKGGVHLAAAVEAKLQADEERAARTARRSAAQRRPPISWTEE